LGVGLALWSAEPSATELAAAKATVLAGALGAALEGQWVAQMASKMALAMALGTEPGWVPRLEGGWGLLSVEPWGGGWVALSALRWGGGWVAPSAMAWERWKVCWWAPGSAAELEVASAAGLGVGSAPWWALAWELGWEVGWGQGWARAWVGELAKATGNAWGLGSAHPKAWAWGLV
jgi:hypothetical protein